MNPFLLFPYVVNDFLTSFHLQTLLQFFVQRGFLRIYFTVQDPIIKSVILYPGSEFSQNIYQSADFNCNYLNEFFSEKFQTTHRMISLNLTTYFLANQINWRDYLIDNSTNDDNNEILKYNRTKIVQLIENIQDWNQSEKIFKDIILEIYNSKANNKNKKEQQEDEIFCQAWKEMIVSVKKEKLDRKVFFIFLNSLIYCFFLFIFNSFILLLEKTS